MNKRVAVFEDGSGFGGAVFSLLENIRNLSNYQFVVVHSLNDLRFGQFSDLCNCAVVFNKYYNFRLGASLIDHIFERTNVYLCIRIIKTLSILHQLKVDIVYTNNDLECNLHAIIAARLMGLKVISHERDTPSFWSAVTKLNFNSVNHLVAVSESTRTAVIGLGFPENKITKIHNGINNHKLIENAAQYSIDFVKFKYNLPLDKKIILMVGMITDWKGQHILLEAAALLQKKHLDLFFVFVGEPPNDENDGYVNGLHNLVQRHNLQNQVSFLGFCPDVAVLINVASIVVHASIQPEPFGRVIIESMALGKPVIASNIGGPVEIINNNVDGFLIDPNNPEVLAYKISELANNDQLCTNVSNNAKKCSQQFFDSQIVAKKMCALFDSI